MTRAQKLTPQIVRDYHAHVEKRYDVEIIYKADAEEMQAIAWSLDALGIKDKEWFLKHFAHTVGRRIYVPWLPGVGSADDLAYQVRVLNHELQHRLQNHGRIAQESAMYLASRPYRARQEMHAMKCDLESCFYLYGKPMSVRKLVAPLKHYKLRWSDRRRVRKGLEAYNKMVAKGMVGTAPVKDCIRWLKKRGG